MNTLPLELENIINEYVEELTVAEKFNKCLNEIENIYYYCDNDKFSVRYYKKRKVLNKRIIGNILQQEYPNSPNIDFLLIEGFINNCSVSVVCCEDVFFVKNNF